MKFGSILFGLILLVDIVVLLVFITCPHPRGESVVIEQLSCFLVVMVLIAFGLTYSRQDRRDQDNDSGDNN